MIVYLATGFSIIGHKGREQQFAHKFMDMYGNWNRLQSYHFKEFWQEDTIKLLKEVKDESKQRKTN